MKRLLASVCLFPAALGGGLLAAPPAGAATYAQVLTATFGTTYTGQSANVTYTVTDSANVTKVAATGSGVAESTDAAGTANTGTYRAAPTFDTTWAYPLRVKWAITGVSGVIAEAVIQSPPAQFVFAFDGSGNVKAAPQTDSPGTTTLLSRIPGTVQPQTGDAYASSQANGTAIASLPSAASIWAYGSRALTDKTGFTSAASNLPADYLSTAEQAKLANMDATISSRLASVSYTAPPTLAQIQGGVPTLAQVSALLPPNFVVMYVDPATGAVRLPTAAPAWAVPSVHTGGH